MVTSTANLLNNPIALQETAGFGPQQVRDPLANIKQSSNPSQAETDRTKLAEDFDQFLLLLTTQLKNQDPTEPLDTNQFTQQLVQFASVEQQIATNKNIERLVDLSGGQGINAGVGYLGQVVEADGNGGMLNNGTASFVYELPAPAANVDVFIADAKGQVVFSGKGSTLSGKNVVTWDGTNSLSGSKMPDGDYYITVRATTGAGDKLDSKTYTSGVVSAVESDPQNGIQLNIGNIKINTEDIKAVRQPVFFQPDNQQQAPAAS